jgi:hypothetical protein
MKRRTLKHLRPKRQPSSITERRALNVSKIEGPRRQRTVIAKPCLCRDDGAVAEERFANHKAESKTPGL